MKGQRSAESLSRAQVEKTRKTLFVCFVGIDGSGKTTLAKKLVDAMKERGVTSYYVYNRLRLFFSRPLYLIGRPLLFRGKDVFDDYSGYSQAKQRLFKNRFICLGYTCLLLFDYFFQVMFKVRLPLALGRNIVCDRYVYDTVVTDLAVAMNYSPERTRGVLRSCLVLCPKPDVIFLVDVPEEVAYRRKKDVPSIDYLRERRTLYLDIGREYGMTILDGSKDLELLEAETRNEVLSRIQV